MDTYHKTNLWHDIATALMFTALGVLLGWVVGALPAEQRAQRGCVAYLAGVPYTVTLTAQQQDQLCREAAQTDQQAYSNGASRAAVALAKYYADTNGTANGED